MRTLLLRFALVGAVLRQHERGLNPKNKCGPCFRLILNEEIDKVMDIALCQIYSNEKERSRRQCKVNQDCDIWENVAPPIIPRLTSHKIVDRIKCSLKTRVENKILIDKITDIKKKYEIQKANKRLLRKYFKLWRDRIVKQNQSDGKDKIQTLLNTLIVNQKSKEPKQAKPVTKKPKKRKSKLIIFNNKINPACYESRYKAQKNIILMQKTKLLEQEKVIEELKFGQVCEDLNKSIAESQLELRELMSQFTTKTKSKLGVPNDSTIEEIEMRCCKAPEILQRMEKRAIERALRREIIKERKKIIDEERKLLAAEIVEKKHQQDEEERCRQLEEIKERRKRELQLQKERQLRRQKYEANCVKADQFHRKKIKLFVMARLYRLMFLKEDNEFKSEIHYEVKVKRKYFAIWRNFLKDKEAMVVLKIRRHYRLTILRKYFQGFKKNVKFVHQNYQVAVDYYDFKLQNHAFSQLHLYVCKERMRRYSLYIKAIKHYNSRILVQYFYQWKSLRAILELEKAKEEKKKKWRARVMQILPDYSPPLADVY